MSLKFSRQTLVTALLGLSIPLWGCQQQPTPQAEDPEWSELTMKLEEAAMQNKIKGTDLARLGQIYLAGSPHNGIKPDIKRAKLFFDLACKSGERDALVACKMAEAISE